MNNLRQAAQQALEALEAMQSYAAAERKGLRICDESIIALRAALAEPEQEPVAWMWRCKPFCNWPEWNVSLKRPADSGRDGNTRTEGYEDVPLYTAPTPRKPLTEDEIADLWDGHTVPVFGKTGINPIVFARAIERAHGIGEQHDQR